MSGKILSFEFFPTLHNKEEFFQKIINETGGGRRIISQYLMVCLFSFLYGVVIGSYHSFIQAVAAGVKVTVLFTLALVICFPAFFIIQYILGSKLKLRQMISIILSGFVLMTAIMISFAPIVIIFLLTGSNYYFLQLLHIAIFFLSGIFGMLTVVEALKYSCETKSIYPQTGVVVFRFWVVILAFVGIQLAWNFRPFLGDRGQPFEWFRHYEGNFYTALIYSAEQLLGGKDKEPAGVGKNNEIYNTNEDVVNDSLMKAIFEDGQGGK
ncbi:MAG: hypothetical protein CVT49_09805 [candidate division Zixibacteria bacterium HGW-Zixibacteria-1]|nr:MAG: hypothetical protein CVT49_09805 [candidate division Zixibacteria bacterium HGW-Zixibacteria-1]